MSAPGYIALLEEEGTARQVGANRPLMLDAGTVGYVRSGHVDLFAVRVEDGEPVGQRTHLLRLAAGDPLIGTGIEPGSGHGMLAVGNAGTVIVQVQHSYLEAIFARPSSWHCAEEFFQTWTVHLCRVLAKGRSPRNGTQLQPGETLALEGVTCVRPALAFGWIQQLRGSSRFLDGPGCRLVENQFLPVAATGWLQTSEQAELRLLTTEQFLSEAQQTGGPWSALGRLNQMALAITEERLEEAALAHRERTRLKILDTETALSSALTGLAAPLRKTADQKTQFPDAPSGAAQDDLLAAYRVVAHATGIRADVPPRTALEGRKDRLSALLHAMRLRSRRVVLRDEWWKRDCGPLLARLSESRRFVALIPKKNGGYRLIDPVGRAERAVDAAVTGTLEPFAHALYQPFPEAALSLPTVLRFGVSGLKGDLLTIGAAALLVGFLGSLTPLAIGLLFGAVIPSADRGQLLQLTVILLLAGITTAVFGVVRGLALLRLQIKTGAKIQAAIWDRLIALPLRFFRNYSAGDLAVRAMNMEQIQQRLSLAVLNPLLNGVVSIFNFALMFYYDPTLAFVAAALLTIALATSFGISYPFLRKHRQILKLQSKTAGLVLQLLNGITKLKVVGGEARAFGLWSNLFSRQRQEQFRLRILGNWLDVFNIVFPVACTLLIFALQTNRSAQLPTGEFLGFVAAFNVSLAAVISTGKAAVSLLGVLPLYEQVRPILAAKPEVDSATREAGELTGKIELQHVSFRYNPDSPFVIHNLSVAINPGQLVAFVGPSGSGKSTLLRLLLGFEFPESGSVYYDEQDLTGLDVRTVRNQIGVVLQSGRVMPGDIYTNIVGTSLSTLSDAWTAARMAGLEDDIKAMPMGMHTMVDETGSTLSGGQRQRLLIARAMVNRPRVLFFDEATSALDNRTQEIVSASLGQLHATRIVIAHRLSTIQHADRICVIRGGELVETGNYDELMRQGGLFYRMAQRQLA